MNDLEQLQSIKTKNALLATIFKLHNDEERYAKAKLFADKLEKQTFTIGFAGHFSAGKSSMINALVDEQLLPTSPIPTSANIVNVKKAEENYAIVHFIDQPPVRFSGEYDIQMVKKYSKDGSQVSQIEIGYKDSALPEGISVMDTPGVDSTDDAHRVSTESALHLADIVFYVMDYNHVQSELNFQFTKELLHYNENIYLIVNQIDKHREEELSFESFQQSVADSFAAWSVYPKGIFFTSLKNPTLSHNDFPSVQEIVRKSIEQKEELFLLSSEATLQKLIDEHKKFLKEEQTSSLLEVEEILSQDEWENREEILEQLEISLKQEALQDEDAWKKEFEVKRKQLLQNAGIMPYEMREQLRLYAESKQDSFKVGFLGSKKKTELEREKRLEDARIQLAKIVNTNITTHLKALMKAMLKDAGVSKDEYMREIEELPLEISADIIQSTLHEGASVTGDAILNYANRVTEAVSRFFIKETDTWKEKGASYVKEAEAGTANASSKLSKLQQKQEAILRIQKIANQHDSFEKLLTAPSIQLRKDRDSLMGQWQEEKARFENSIRAYDPSEQEQKEETVVQKQEELVEEKQDVLPVDQIVQRASRISEILSELPEFKEAAAVITRKALRVQKQQFTIALFGAFSAGKSSFSNALMGANVLPVSPNPTTAAINKIHPVSAEHAHNTADVTLKTASQLLVDVQFAYEQLGIQVSSLEEAYTKAPSILEGTAHQEVHKSFIAAYYKGFDHVKDKLGEVLRVDGEDFRRYVAEESKSCFVDNIDFYYDCELTRLGVTLVDTPGADSINARHTGVAFDYIRNADAILFVTYYNHAFAKADREFLIQLGRVKDAFELDKMFFIVNAIDLASNEEEAELVKQYVKDELQRFGIRFPRVYGVSSLEALKEKVDGKPLHEGMKQFESAFEQFLEKDLKQIAVTALDEEATRQKEKLHSLIEQTERNLARKPERLVELKQQEQQISARYEKINATNITKAAIDELESLIYYLHQRVFYRFNEFFREAYNPSLFANQSASVALDIALKDILDMLRFDLEQELRVTNFRILQYSQKQVKQLEKEEIRFLKELNDSFAFTPMEPSDEELLEFTGPFQERSKYAGVKSYYKNQKSFFEKNEKEKLRDALAEQTKKDAEVYLQGELTRISEWVEVYVIKEIEGLRSKLVEDSVKQIDAERNLLEKEDILALWKEIYQRIDEGEQAS